MKEEPTPRTFCTPEATPEPGAQGNPASALAPSAAPEGGLRAGDGEDHVQALRGLFEHAPAGFALFDAAPPYRVLAHNRIYQAFFDEPFRSDGMVGRTIPEYAPRAAEDGILDIFREVAATGQGRTIYAFPYDGMARGRTYWNWNLSPVVREGRVTAFAHMLLEVTESVQAQQALAERVAERTRELEATNATLRAIIDNIPVMLTFYDREGRFRLVNRAFEERLGWTVADLAGGDPMRAFYPDPALREAVWTYMLEGKTDWRDFPVTAKDGSAVDSAWANVRLPDGSQIGIGLDVRDRKRVERELRAANVALAERAAQLHAMALKLSDAEQRERRRIAEVLHDHLQQLLTAARFSLGLARRRAKGEAKLGSALDSVDRLLGESLDASRSLTYDLSPPILNEGEIVAVLEWLADRMSEKHGLSVQVDARPLVGENLELAQPLRVFLFQSVREMLFNVVKHAGVREARVRLARRPGRLDVEVTDRGAGFDPAAVAGAANPGFGLFTVRERAELMGGALVIESAPGKGSQLRLSVPVLGSREATPPPPEPASAAAPPVAGSAPAAAGRTLRILLADDHQLMREGLAALLDEEDGIEVVAEAANGREAVTLAHQVRPDVVVMDVTMPEMDGIEATRLLRSELPDIRVVGLSMHDDADTAIRMLAAGATLYLDKADPGEALVSALRALR